MRCTEGVVAMRCMQKQTNPNAKGDHQGFCPSPCKPRAVFLFKRPCQHSAATPLNEDAHKQGGITAAAMSAHTLARIITASVSARELRRGRA